MGEVLRVLDLADDRQVALKRCSDDQPTTALQFRREFLTLAGLRHPRIVEVHDHGFDEGRPYYTMELLDGRDLRDVGKLGVSEACRVVADVASALAFLHSKRLVHRDVAPRNVRYTADGRGKLIDFGVLATVGAWGEIVGTVPYVAPELLLGGQVDQRADLFSLGGLAYLLLTGRPAFEAKTVVDLVFAQRRRPAPPSARTRGIPPTLDDLVLSLLSIQPLGRPASAVAVGDRIRAIGGLDASHEKDVARGYVLSAGLVGRAREMRVIEARVRRAVGGRGNAIVVRGRPGTGKSRLLREAGVEAQLAGATVLRVSAESAEGGPYGVFRALARHLLEVAPEDALHAAGANMAVLVRAFPEFAQRLGIEAPASEQLDLRTDLREQRLQVQEAVSSWVLAAARRRPLCLLVDDVHAADGGSAAALAALAHESHGASLLLVTALRSGEPIRAAGAVAKLREESLRLRARLLGAADVEQLVREMFGEGWNLVRLANWMHDATGGNVHECTELARSLVDRGLVRFADGMWVVPDDPSDLPVETDQAGATRRRWGALTAAARDLGSAMVVHGGSMSVARCADLARLAGVDDVLGALAELVQEDLCEVAGEDYRFRQRSVRETLLASMPRPRRAELERGVGELLSLTAGVTPDTEGPIGWHLLRGGQRRRAADLLDRAGRRLFDATSFEDAIEPLEAALEVYEAEGGSPRVLAELRFMLLAAGFYGDRATAVRHRDLALRTLGHYSGYVLVGHLGRFLGRHVALAIGLAIVVVRHAFTRPSRRGPWVIDAIRMYARAVVYSAGLAAFSFDQEELRKLVPALEPMSVIYRVDTRTAPRFVETLYRYNRGELAKVRELAVGVLADLATDTVLSDGERKTLEGGTRFQLAMTYVRSGSPRALDEIARLEALGTRIWHLGALQLRALHHIWRGEERLSRATWAQAEIEFIRLGASWQLESTFHSSACNPYAFTEDLLGLKRSIAALDPVALDRPNFRQHVEISKGEYHRLRGEYELARASLTRALELMPEHALMKPWCLSALAKTLVALGDVDGALRVAKEGMALGETRDRVSCAVALAAAEARRGATGGAREILEALLEESVEIQSPVVTGALHEALALYELAAGRQAAYERHAQAMNEAFLPTENPVLIARCERLARAAAPPRTSAPPADPDASDLVTLVEKEPG